ncbi:SycD/LcrH family type III secretion system chaperone [uncultured Endozoicomonas sp.]|uniref:SycD/LcrH family type III secretion system chaperone n=1 Tax=uncultured Endozoicomonas sp. TaxID=432652 RepID=UPI0026244C7C|nr:SycD/LcrH family type III secretion system chaperone [uncultured Endozoicomonas sp.]
MNNNELNGETFEDELMGFFSKGGTFKDLKDVSDDAMEAIYSVAYNLYQSGKYDEAQQIFQFLCFYDHFNRKYFMGLGACQQMKKEFDKAIEVFSFATLLDSDDPRPMIYIGDCHMGKGDKEKAKIAYETSMDWAGESTDYAQDIERAKNMLENLE